MSIARTIFALTCLAALGVGIACYRASARRPIWERLALAVLPFLSCTVAWHWVVSIAFYSMSGYWKGARLAPAMGLMDGYTLYRPADSGPLNGWIYGPVAAVAYLPAVLIANPAVKIVVARVLSLIYYYGPAAWLLLGGGGGRRGRPGLGSLLLFLTFVLLSGYSRALRHSATEVHADAPALGLAAMAIAVMVRGGGGRNPWTCALSLMLAVLAVWAKHLTAPLLLVVLPAYALATGAFRSPLRFVVPGFVGGLGITLILLAALEPRNLLFNVVEDPSRHPLRIGLMIDVVYPLIVLQQRHAPLLMLLAVGGLGRFAAAKASPSASGTAGPGLLEGNWLVFLIAGLAELPLSTRAYAMAGANDSSMSFSIYFLALGVLLLLRPLLDARGEDGREPTPWAWYLLVGLGLMLAIVEDETLGVALVECKGAWQESVVAERFIREPPGFDNPGRVASRLGE